jgi:uncharacterized protein (TIGR02118 family)
VAIDIDSAGKVGAIVDATCFSLYATKNVAAGEGESPYYCVFEADFDDAAALSAARESPEGQAVRADVPNYATGGAVVLNYELRAG